MCGFPNSYRHNGEDSFGWRVAEEDVDEGDHLQSFPQTHAVGQDTAKATAGLKPLQGLNQVIVQEPDPADLTRDAHGQMSEGLAEASTPVLPTSELVRIMDMSRYYPTPDS